MAKNSESIDKTAREIGEQSKDAGNKISNSLVNLSVNIDVSPALKGLKAIQREVKKTARALREVEGMSPKDAILRLTDDEIFEVLSSRGWEIETAVLSDEFDNPNMSSVNMYKNHKPQN